MPVRLAFERKGKLWVQPEGGPGLERPGGGGGGQLPAGVEFSGSTLFWQHKTSGGFRLTAVDARTIETAETLEFHDLTIQIYGDGGLPAGFQETAIKFPFVGVGGLQSHGGKTTAAGGFYMDFPWFYSSAWPKLAAALPQDAQDYINNEIRANHIFRNATIVRPSVNVRRFVSSTTWANFQLTDLGSPWPVVLEFVRT